MICREECMLLIVVSMLWYLSLSLERDRRAGCHHAWMGRAARVHRHEKNEK